MNEFEEIILAEIRKKMNIQVEIPINLEFLRGIEYEHASYNNDIKAILKKQDVSSINSLPSEGNGGTSDNLLIYLLKQNGRTDRIVAVLDRFELWSNPSVIDIF